MKSIWEIHVDHDYSHKHNNGQNKHTGNEFNKQQNVSYFENHNW